MSESEPLEFKAGSDAGAFVVDDSTFRMLVDLETRKAQRLRYWVSVLCLDVASAGRDRDNHPESLGRRIARSIRATDAVTAINESSASLLLVGAEAASLETVLHRVTNGLESTRWCAGGACYPTTAASGHDLVDQAAAMLAEARRDGGGRLHLPS